MRNDFGFWILDFGFWIRDHRLRIAESRSVAARLPNPKSKIQNPKSRSGITLTEILIAIMILGVGLVSLATLFPIGLLRLRDAARSTRTKYLTDSAAADAAARGVFVGQPGLLNTNSFAVADLFNIQYSFGASPWWWILNPPNPPYNWSPLSQDTSFYGDDPRDQNNLGPGATNLQSGGYGLPFAYDPLWRYQTINPLNPQANGPNQLPGGYYLFDNQALEARFASGIGFIRPDASGGGTVASAHGLQRITNFNRAYTTDLLGNIIPVMPQSTLVPNIFVSQEDVVWQEGANLTYTIGGVPVAKGGVPVNAPSPVLPDVSLPSSPGVPTNDWHYSWMFTGYQVSGTGGSQYEGNIVIFENRPFGINLAPAAPFPPPAPFQATQVDGETVVEAIFGHSGNINANGYATGADRTGLLRWSASQADPAVHVGDWIADVTYERQQWIVYNTNTQTGRFMFFNQALNAVTGVANLSNKGEWDNLPAQRCFWYQVQKVLPVVDDPYTAAPPQMRSMVVYVDQSLQAKTLLSAIGTPVYFNAALIAPNVVNVIPQQITVRVSP